MLQIQTSVQIYQTFRQSYFTKPIVTKFTNNSSINTSTDGCKFMRLDFNNAFDYTIDKSWDNLSQVAKVSIPMKVKKVVGSEVDINFNKNQKDVLKIINLNKDYVSLASKKSGYSVFAGLTDGTGKIQSDTSEIDREDIGFKLNPIISVGDIIYIKRVYISRNNRTDKETFLTTNIDTFYLNEQGTISANISDVNNLDSFHFSNRYQVFRGYITKIDIDTDGNTHLTCEDAMYYLNRARVPNKIYSSSFGTQSKPADKALLNTIKQNPNYYSNTKGHSINTILNDMLGKTPCIIDSSNKVICGSTQSGIQNILSLPAPIYCYATSENLVIKNQPLAVVNSKYIIYSHGIALDKNLDTNVGDCTLENTTVGGFLEKVKNESEIPSYVFVNGSNTNLRLYCNTFTYKDYNSVLMDKAKDWVPYNTQGNQKTTNRPNSEYHIFTFNYDIISSNLNWVDKSDNPVGCIVKSDYKIEKTTKTKKGKTKKKTEEISLSIDDTFGTVYTFIYHSTSATYNSKKTLSGNIISGTTDIQKLKDDMTAFGKQQLAMKYYTGYYGSFTTFGYPYIEYGDVVTILDKNFPERSGTYYVKKVITTFNFSIAIQQEIFIDFKIPNPIDIATFINANPEKQTNF